RVGVVTHREQHVGGFDRQFATLLTNDFIIGEGNKPSISLPKGKLCQTDYL
ncbi:16135_t:CDS:2, partial [Gigaspora rosea]